MATTTTRTPRLRRPGVKKPTGSRPADPFATPLVPGSTQEAERRRVLTRLSQGAAPLGPVGPAAPYAMPAGGVTTPKLRAPDQVPRALPGAPKLAPAVPGQTAGLSEMAGTGVIKTPLTDQQQAALAPGRMANSLTRAIPTLSTDIQSLSPEQLAALSGFEDRYGAGLVADLVEGYGSEILYAAPSELTRIMQSFNQLVTNADGTPVMVEDAFTGELRPQLMAEIDPMAVDTAVMGIVEAIQERLHQEETAAAGIQTLEELQAGLGETGGDVTDYFEEQAQQYEEWAETPVMSDEQLTGLIREADNLIQREFGQFQTAAGQQLASGGFGTGTFVASLDAMNQQRANEAQLGSRTELWKMQTQVNAEHAYRYNQLAAVTRDVGSRNRMFFEQLIYDAGKGIAALQAGQPFVPSAVVEAGEYLASFADELMSGRYLAEELDPNIFDVIVNGLMGGSEQSAAYVATSGFQRLFG